MALRSTHLNMSLLLPLTVRRHRASECDMAANGRAHSNTELFGVLRMQPLPAELHRLGSNDAADWRATEQAIQHIEADVPSRRPHRDEAAIDVGPQRQACAVPHAF